MGNGSCAAGCEWSYWAVRRLRCWVGKVDDGCGAARWEWSNWAVRRLRCLVEEVDERSALLGGRGVTTGRYDGCAAWLERWTMVVAQRGLRC